jgi:hypothetical protein
MWDVALNESESYWLEDKKVKEIIKAKIITRTDVRIHVYLIIIHICIYIYINTYMYIYVCINVFIDMYLFGRRIKIVIEAKIVTRTEVYICMCM